MSNAKFSANEERVARFFAAFVAQVCIDEGFLFGDGDLCLAFLGSNFEDAFCYILVLRM